MTTLDGRSRVVTWDDPIASLEVARGMGGIDVLRAIEGGQLPPPPVAQLIGLEVDQVSEGLVTFAFEPAEFHYNPLGTVHGGILTTVLDSAMGCAVHSRLRAGLSYTTLELKVNFLKPVRVTTGRVRGEGKVVHLGGRVATAEAHLVDGEGALYAHATSTCLISAPGSGATGEGAACWPPSNRHRSRRDRSLGATSSSATGHTSRSASFRRPTRTRSSACSTASPPSRSITASSPRCPSPDAPR